MAAPLFVIAAKVIQIAALKARFLSQMGPLQSYLANYVGASAAGIGVGILAKAAAAATYARMNGKSQDEIERAAREEGVEEGVAAAIRQFVS